MFRAFEAPLHSLKKMNFVFSAYQNSSVFPDSLAVSTEVEVGPHFNDDVQTTGDIFLNRNLAQLDDA